MTEVETGADNMVAGRVVVADLCSQRVVAQAALLAVMGRDNAAE